MPRPPLGQRFFEERERRGWTLDKAAAETVALGHPVKRGTIYAIEEGISDDPRRKHIEALGLLYGIPSEELGRLSYYAPSEEGEEERPRSKNGGGARKATVST
jgi:transcriptional regulator with XRE-family HTH domain